MANVKVSIITIGDELLIGQTIDTNSAWMAQRLNEFGIEVTRRVAVGDNAADIKNTLDEEIPRADLILLTGGLGPTADDITKPLLAEYFGGKMIVNEEVLAHVKDIFEKRGRPLLERNLKQAEVPDTCHVFFNRMGTAPGMMFQKDGKRVISMPGVPFEMIAIMEDEVLPFVKKHYLSDALVHRTIFTAGEGESFIAEKIHDLETGLPSHIRLAYLPTPGIVRLRLTGRAKEEASLIQEVEHYQRIIAERLEDIVISMYDIPLEQILGDSLSAKNLTVGFAESCTGGYIGHKVTEAVGSSRYMKGSLVCYLVDVKQKVLGVKKETLDIHGAVSEQTAIEMVQGALHVLGCDCALSITGMLGPAGEEDEAPVGTVWMAVADKTRVCTKRFHFHFDRVRNKDVSVQMALLMVWKFINGKI